MRLIQLDQREAKLCLLLRQAAAHFPRLYDGEMYNNMSLLNNGAATQQPTLRIAGGWVRDKILGRPSHDLDITLDTMSGFQFASYLSAYLHSLPPDILEGVSALQHDFTESQQQQPAKQVGSVHKVKSNPDKSKHLETATMQLFGMEVDFCNLRKETYAQGHSRVPVIEIGTPLEDAMRRDLTINSLFYNIHSEQVEDHLGTGLRDLRDGIIRTPLPPLETFRDDPLRVLRTIRFASRFNYSVVHEIPVAIRDPSISKLLRTVISKERIGEELRKMLCGPHPALAVRYISEYQLFNTIFQLPDPSTNVSSTETVVKVPALHEHQLGTPMAAARLVRLVQRFLLSEDDQAQDGIVGNENWDAEELASAISVYQQSLIFRRSMNLLHSSKVLLYLAATLIPYRNQLVVMGRQQSSQKPPITIPGPLYIAKNSLKFPNSDCESVARLLWSVDVLIDWAHRRRESFTTINQTKTDHSIEQYKQLRHDLAVLVRDLAGIGIGHGNVDIPILFAAVVDYAVSTYPAENAASSDYGADEALADYGEFAVRLMPYLELAAQIERMGVQNAASEQPLLNGNEVVAYLRAKGTSNQVRPGKWLGQVLERMLEWQFREGAAATKPGALAIVDQAWEDGTIPRQFH